MIIGLYQTELHTASLYNIYIYIYIYIQSESVNLDIIYPTNPPSKTLLPVTDLAPL